MTETTIQTVDKKLTDPAFFADEDRFYDLFAQLRRDGPVYWTVGPDGLGLWSVFKDADVKKILNDMVRSAFRLVSMTSPISD